MQRRLSKQEKEQLCIDYKSNIFSFADLAVKYNVSSQAIKGLLNRRGYKCNKTQSELQRKYFIKENYFDDIDCQEKAYILGLLYADGYNNTDRNCVNLSLAEIDVSILEHISKLIQPDKPLQYTKTRDNCQNQYRLIIANKHISKRMVDLGVTKAKTFTITFPNEGIIPKHLIRHFIRGYLDGDGCIMKKSICFVATEAFCASLERIFKENLGVNCYIRARHPERNHNIRMCEISGSNQSLQLLNWLYEGSIIHFDRKFQKYLIMKERKRLQQLPKPIIKCKVDGCENDAKSLGYCRKHYYHLCGGKEKRRLRYLQKNK